VKGYSWLSYWSISLSTIPIIVFYAAMYGYIRMNFTLLVTFLFIILALSVVLGIIGIEKNSGKKLLLLASLGTVIAIMSCFLIVSILLMSQMA